MALSALFLVAAFGLASGHGLGSPCWPDMKKLCPEEVKQKPPMPFFKTDCFIKNKDKLSPACQAMYEFHEVRHEMKTVVDGFFKDMHKAIADKAALPPMPALPVGWANIAIMPADHTPMDAMNGAGGEKGEVEAQGWKKHMHEHNHGKDGHGKGPFREHMRKFCGADSDRLCGTEGPRCHKWRCLSANIDKVSEECKSVLAAARAWHMRFHANDNAMEHMRMMHQQPAEAPVAEVEVEAKSEQAEPEVSPQDFLQCYVMVAALLMALSVTLTLLLSSVRAKSQPATPASVYVPVPTFEEEDTPAKPVKA